MLRKFIKPEKDMNRAWIRVQILRKKITKKRAYAPFVLLCFNLFAFGFSSEKFH